MLYNGLSACQCEIALLQVVGGAYNFQCFLFHCVPIVHCTGWPDSVHSIKGKEGSSLAELIQTLYPAEYSQFGYPHLVQLYGMAVAGQLVESHSVELYPLDLQYLVATWVW